MAVKLKKPNLSRRFLNENGEIFATMVDLKDKAFKDAVRQLGPQASALTGISDFLVEFVYNNRDDLKAILSFDFTPQPQADEESRSPVKMVLAPVQPDQPIPVRPWGIPEQSQFAAAPGQMPAAPLTAPPPPAPFAKPDADIDAKDLEDDISKELSK